MKFKKYEFILFIKIVAISNITPRLRWKNLICSRSPPGMYWARTLPSQSFSRSFPTRRTRIWSRRIPVNNIGTQYYYDQKCNCLTNVLIMPIILLCLNVFNFIIEYNHEIQSVFKLNTLVSYSWIQIRVSSAH